jgi:hypothetical protein
MNNQGADSLYHTLPVGNGPAANLCHQDFLSIAEGFNLVTNWKALVQSCNGGFLLVTAGHPSDLPKPLFLLTIFFCVCILVVFIPLPSQAIS